MYLQVTRYSDSVYGQKRPLWTMFAQPVALASAPIALSDSFLGVQTAPHLGPGTKVNRQIGLYSLAASAACVSVFVLASLPNGQVNEIYA